MSFTNILVPYDGSDHAKEALREAMKMVEGNTDASIHVAEISAPPQDLVFSSFNQTGFGMGVSLVSKEDFADAVQERTEESDKKLEADVADIVKDFKGNLTVEVIYGIYTVETIIETAQRYECDLICMGSRGLGRFAACSVRSASACCATLTFLCSFANKPLGFNRIEWF